MSKERIKCLQENSKKKRLTDQEVNCVQRILQCCRRIFSIRDSDVVGHKTLIHQQGFALASLQNLANPIRLISTQHFHELIVKSWHYFLCNSRFNAESYFLLYRFFNKQNSWTVSPKNITSSKSIIEIARILWPGLSWGQTSSNTLWRYRVQIRQSESLQNKTPQRVYNPQHDRNINNPRGSQFMTLLLQSTWWTGGTIK